MNDDTIRAFKNDIIEQNWEYVCNENDMNSAYVKFIKTFTSLHDKNCPVKKICITKRGNHHCVTNGLRDTFHKKTYCKKKF